ncbi:MAG TPA: S53 family peptidase [Candidatus Acidoferrum sp.]|jgi:subtilase family serine protease
MRKFCSLLIIASAFFFLSPKSNSAQQLNGSRAKGQVMRPGSSVEHPGDAGVNAHTHLRMLVPSTGQFGNATLLTATGQPPFLGVFFETPASIACIYHLVKNPKPGCNPDETTEPPTGGGGAIALIDAFDDPTAAADLATFSTQFGLPAANLTVVFSNGKPAVDPSGGAEIETSLDIEWAHAMAPKAKLFLVEAPSLRLGDLFNAILVGANLVAANGGGEVSMSFGSGEFPQENQLDNVFFNTPGVVYVASSGDAPGVQYPSASPNVVSAGGATVSRDSTTGRFLLENTWQDGGGGPSQVELRPSFQNEVRQIVGAARGTPDISFDANPNTGVWVFDTNPVFGQGWFVLGGTSVAAPSLAGIINAAGSFRASSQLENHQIYNHLFDRDALRDIIFGNCGINIGDFALPGYDFCTGVGTSQTYEGK